MYAIICYLVILSAYTYCYLAKQRLIFERDMDASKILWIDMINLCLFTLFMTNLLVVLIQFKLMERDYKIRIRKPQLAATFILGLATVVISSLQLYSGHLQILLFDESECVLGH